jgi:acetyl esterase
MNRNPEGGRVTVESLMAKVPVWVQALVVRLLFWLPRPLRRLITGPAVRADGQQLSSDMQLLLRILSLQNHTLTGGAIEQAREMLDEATAIVSGPPIEPVEARDVTLPTGAGPLSARLYTPPGCPQRSPLLVFYHGGGFALGSLASHDQPCRFLAQRAGLRVLSVDYRLAPENPFPAAVEDAEAAWSYIATHATEFSADPAAIAVGGDSAGGNLAAVVAHRASGSGGPRPCFVLSIYPVTDVAGGGRSRELFPEGFFLTGEDLEVFTNWYFPDRSRAGDPKASILRAEDLSGMPPTYVATNGFDPLRDEGEAFARKLAEQGVPVVARRYGDMIHGWVNFLGVGTRPAEAMAELAAALRMGVTLHSETARADRAA